MNPFNKYESLNSLYDKIQKNKKYLLNRNRDDEHNFHFPKLQDKDIKAVFGNYSSFDFHKKNLETFAPDKLLDHIRVIYIFMLDGSTWTLGFDTSAYKLDERKKKIQFLKNKNERLEKGNAYV